MMKKFIVNKFPFLGKYKRQFVALKDTLIDKKTYSQHGEDSFMLEKLSGFDLKNSIYLDIGANHPTDISNTYLLYKNGLSGVIIEPNIELANLFRVYRKRDTVLCMGCGSKPGVMPFYVSKTPVISSFKNDPKDINTYKAYYVPLLSVDEILGNIKFSFINFMSVDVEGMNLEVLASATKTLEKVLFLCVEFDHEKEKVEIENILGEKFSMIATLGCNYVFKNTSLAESIQN